MTTPPGSSGDQPHPSDPQQPGYGSGDSGGSYPPPGGYGGPPPGGGYGGPPPGGGYGAPPPGGGYPPAPGGYGQPRQSHPRSTTALVLGIVGLLCCSFAAPFAWVIGKKAVREIDAEPERYDGRGAAQAGYILGVIGTVLLAILVVFIAVSIAVGGFTFEFETSP
jgi:hypothetical protein